jgi:xylulokinase
MGTYLIAVDIGTQGTKAALFDKDLQLIASAFEASRLISPKPGVVWQEPVEMLDACCHTIRELMEKTGVHPADIAAIGLDGQMAGIMGIDEAGEASTWFDSWLDMRCGPFMDEMNEKAGQRIIELSGGPATYVHGPKILWWKMTQPEAYQRTAKFVLPHAYIVGKMCGLRAQQAYFDYTHLHFSCLSDNKNKAWSNELLDAFGIDRDKMPRIVSPFEVVGTLNAEFAKRCGLVTGIPMVAGCGDTAASTFGSGMFEPGMVLDIAGTASVLCSVVDKFNPDVEHKTLTMMRSPVDGLFLPLAYVNGGGQCIRWFRDMLSAKEKTSYDQLQEEADQVACGSEGLIFIPHFSGRVLPNNPHLKGSFIGLDFRHTRGHLYRAILESIAYEYDYYLSVLKKLYPGTSFNTLLSLGGGANSSLFSQIKADVLGLNVLTLKLGETALIGSAVIAGMGVGLLDEYAGPIKQAIQPGASYRSDLTRHKSYEPYSSAYLESMECLSALYRRSPVLGKA